MKKEILNLYAKTWFKKWWLLLFFFKLCLVICCCPLTTSYVARFGNGRRQRTKESWYAFCFQERPLSKQSESNWPSQRIQQIKKVRSKINLRWKLLKNFLWKIDNQILQISKGLPKTSQQSYHCIYLKIWFSWLCCMRYLKWLSK